MQTIDTRQQILDFINSDGKFTKIVFFWASWSEACTDFDKLILELKDDKEYGNDYEIAKLVAEGNEDLAKEYEVNSVPTILAFQKGKLIERIEGFLPIKLKELLIKSTFDAIAAKKENIDKKRETAEKAEEVKSEEKRQEELNERLKRLINKERLTLFMKGSPSEPKCGFSQQIVKILKANNVQFWTFDILQDEQVRQGLKIYSDWPTYPQLYLDGELLGGIDVVREEMKDPAFVEKLPKLP
ncbi:hypothetical protein ACQ4LE_007267 [Meloidogyne hapla]|uniref:Thioredoxin domain-containing protein n=1 Tax=Meloidogyne hapla TaxID=6305 RepID=A0A1I8C0S2_MELHA